MTSVASRKPPAERPFVEPLAALLHGLRLGGLAIGVDDAVRVAEVFRYAGGWPRERRVEVLKALVARSDEERLLIEQLAPHLFVEDVSTTTDVHEVRGGIDPRPGSVGQKERRIRHERLESEPEEERDLAAPASVTPAEEVPGPRPTERATVPQSKPATTTQSQPPLNDLAVHQASGEKIQQMVIEESEPEQAVADLERLARSEGPRTYRLEIPEPTTPLKASLVYEAAFHLSAPSVPAPTPWLEGHKTVEATVTQGGRLCLRYATRLTHSPVLFLEDVSSSMARWPDHGRQFVKALERQGNDVVRCFMSGTPDALSPHRRMSRALPWSQFVESMGHPTTLVLSDAKSLDRATARRADWLGTFRKAVWLHPQPPELWGPGARWLAGQARVVPLSDEGLLRLTTPRLDSGELPPRWRPSRSGTAATTARLSAIRAAVGEAFWWLCAGAVFDCLHALSARLWWKLAEEVVEAPLSGIQRVWALPEVRVFSDGTVRLRDGLGRALLKSLEQERPDLLADIVKWGTSVVARDLERLPDSLATVSARAYRGSLRVLDVGQREQGRQDLEILEAKGYGKWIPEPVQETLRLSEALERQYPIEEVFGENFDLGSDWKQRRSFFKIIPERAGHLERALAWLDQLRRRTRDGNDLFFLDQTLVAISDRYPAAAARIAKLRGSLHDHIAPPPEALFRWTETGDGNVPFWSSVPGGTFLMGSPAREGHDWERSQHPVFVTSRFSISKVPVTNAQYAAFDPKHADVNRPSHPVVDVSWWAAVAFCRWLATVFPGARLPTEEEWEYAARGGTTTRYWSGDHEEDLARVGWYSRNSGGALHPVGDKESNPWGLYDVHGNVREWTLSDYTGYAGRETGVEHHPAAISIAEAVEAAISGDRRRAVRGGAFNTGADSARVADRDGYPPDVEYEGLGFRVVVP